MTKPAEDKEESEIPNVKKKSSQMPEIGLIPESVSNYYNPSEEGDPSGGGKEETIPVEELEKWKHMVGFILSNINSEASKKEILGALHLSLIHI